MEKDVNAALEAIEKVAKHGRAAWEMLFTKLDNSEEQGEISQFLQEYVENEGNW